MNKRIIRHAASCLTIAAIAGTGVVAYAVTNCTSTGACVTGTNTGSGPGVAGTSSLGSGVTGATKLNSTSSVFAYGVYGQDSSTSGTNDAGVNGVSVRGVGVSGKSTSNYGVLGTSTQNFGVFGVGTPGVTGVSTTAGSAGVHGVDLNSSGAGAQGIGGFYGVYGQATTYGVYGNNTGGTGVYGAVANGGSAGSFMSNSNLALYATSHSGFGLYAHSELKTAAAIDSSTNDGVIASGSLYGVLAEAASSDYGLLAQDSSGANLFYVDGSGDVGYHGSIHLFLQTAQGRPTYASSAQAKQPTIEDSGTARLTNGRAVVALDPTFARATEGRNYRVIVSPDGETQGIYVIAKTGSQFVVQEAGGGRGTVAFDYYVSAAENGGSGPHTSTSASHAIASDPRPASPPGGSQPQTAPISAPDDVSQSAGGPAAYSVTNCSTAAACVAGNNTGSGPGVAGISSLGSGVHGVTKFNSTSTTAAYGIYGQDLSTSGTNDAGVSGTSVRGVGISGKSTTNYGVRGTSAQNAGVSGTGVTGVYGTGSVSAGVWGTSAGTSATGAKGQGLLYGVYGTTTGAQSSNGIDGRAPAAGTGVFGTSNGGIGGEFLSSTNTALVATSSDGIALQVHSTTNAGALFESGNYIAAVIRGTPIAVLTTAPSSGFPLLAGQSNGGPTVFYVTGTGDVYCHSTVQFLSTARGAKSASYGARSMGDSLEDSGTAHLVNGSAIVRLDSAHFSTIVSDGSYHVFLTADGESRGVYVAVKSPSQFVVREAEGGHDSFTFDYHIYAQSRRQAGEQIVPPRPPRY
jgi:hypothetical protein